MLNFTIAQAHALYPQKSCLHRKAPSPSPLTGVRKLTKDEGYEAQLHAGCQLGQMFLQNSNLVSISRHFGASIQPSVLVSESVESGGSVSQFLWANKSEMFGVQHLGFGVTRLSKPRVVSVFCCNYEGLCNARREYRKILVL